MGEVVEHNEFLYDHDYHTTKKTMKRFYQQSSSSLEGYQEEEAFADDTIRGGRVGGSIWPPRSYSCSFCKREFRSAQALGGHMNVHRRDRALLKQVITSHNNDHDHDHDHGHLNHRDHDRDHVVSPSSKALVPQNPSQVCSPRTSVAHHQCHSRVSSNSVISGVRKVISSTNDVVRANNSMGLDLAIGTYQEEENHHENVSKYKRCKKNGDYNNVALTPCFEAIKCSIKNNSDLQAPKNLSLKDSIFMEELDLELRLGEPPQKVK